MVTLKQATVILAVRRAVNGLSASERSVPASGHLVTRYATGLTKFQAEAYLNEFADEDW